MYAWNEALYVLLPEGDRLVYIQKKSETINGLSDRSIALEL